MKNLTEGPSPFSGPTASEDLTTEQKAHVVQRIDRAIEILNSVVADVENVDLTNTIYDAIDQIQESWRSCDEGSWTQTDDTDENE